MKKEKKSKTSLITSKLKNRGYFFLRFIPIVILFFGLHTLENSKINEIHTISVNFSDFPDKALAKACIQGKTVSLLIDTGSCAEFSLQTSVLHYIKEKKFLEKLEVIGVKGDVYSLQNFLVPSVTLGNIKLKQITAREENDDFFINAGVLHSAPLSEIRTQKKIKYIQGKLGRMFLSQWTCLFDYPNSKLLLSKNTKSLISLYPSEKFIVIPFLNQKGITVSLNTDYGKKTFLLDTGANVSLLRKSQVSTKLAQEIHPGLWKCKVNTLEWDHQELGGSDFYLHDFCHEIPADGVLGIDFFKTHIVLIDFNDQLLYISNP